MLESRPVLLPPQAKVTAKLAKPAERVKVMVDGVLTAVLQEGQFLTAEAAAKPLRLISSPHKGYFAILRSKLNWASCDCGSPLPSCLRAVQSAAVSTLR
jgi:NAD kinase